MKYYDNPKGMIPTWLINWGAKVSMIYYLYSGLVCVALFKVLLPQTLVTIAKLGYPVFRRFGFIAPKNYLVFRSFDFEYT